MPAIVILLLACASARARQVDAAAEVSTWRDDGASGDTPAAMAFSSPSKLQAGIWTVPAYLLQVVDPVTGAHQVLPAGGGDGERQHMPKREDVLLRLHPRLRTLPSKVSLQAPMAAMTNNADGGSVPTECSDLAGTWSSPEGDHMTLAHDSPHLLRITGCLPGAPSGCRWYMLSSTVTTFLAILPSGDAVVPLYMDSSGYWQGFGYTCVITPDCNTLSIFNAGGVITAWTRVLPLLAGVSSERLVEQARDNSGIVSSGRCNALSASGAVITGMWNAFAGGLTPAQSVGVAMTRVNVSLACATCRAALCVLPGGPSWVQAALVATDLGMDACFLPAMSPCNGVMPAPTQESCTSAGGVFVQGEAALSCNVLWWPAASGNTHVWQLAQNAGGDIIPSCGTQDEGCVNGVCTADFHCVCTAGWRVDPTTGACTEAICNVPCGPHGHCAAPNHCECADGFTGTYCGRMSCEPCTPGHGFCVSAGECVCFDGYTGTGCEQPMCDNPVCVHGSCGAPQECSCDPGYAEPEGGCVVGVCSQPCEHGSCTGPDECTCEPFWSGRSCNVTDTLGTHLMALQQTDTSIGDALWAASAYADFTNHLLWRVGAMSASTVLASATAAARWGVHIAAYSAPAVSPAVQLCILDVFGPTANCVPFATPQPISALISTVVDYLYGFTSTAVDGADGPILVPALLLIDSETVVPPPVPLGTVCTAPPVQALVTSVEESIFFTCEGAPNAWLLDTADRTRIAPIPVFGTEEWAANAISLASLGGVLYFMSGFQEMYAYDLSSQQAVRITQAWTSAVPATLVADADTNALLLVSAGTLFRVQRSDVAGRAGSVNLDAWTHAPLKRAGAFVGARLAVYSYGMLYIVQADACIAATTVGSVDEDIELLPGSAAGSGPLSMARGSPLASWGSLLLGISKDASDVIAINAHTGEHRVMNPHAFVGPLRVDAPLLVAVNRTVYAICQYAGQVLCVLDLETGIMGQRGSASSAAFLGMVMVGSTQLFAIVAGTPSLQKVDTYTGERTSNVTVPLMTQVYDMVSVRSEIFVLMTPVESGTCAGPSQRRLARIAPFAEVQQFTCLATTFAPAGDIDMLAALNGGLFVLQQSTLYGVDRGTGAAHMIGTEGRWAGITRLHGFVNHSVWYDAGTHIEYAYGSKSRSRAQNANETSGLQIVGADTWYVSNLTAVMEVFAVSPFYAFINLTISDVDVLVNDTSAGGEVSPAKFYDTGLPLVIVQYNNGSVLRAYAAANDSTSAVNYKKAIASMMNTYTGYRDDTLEVHEHDVTGLYGASYTFPSPGVSRRVKHNISHPEAELRSMGAMLGHRDLPRDLTIQRMNAVRVDQQDNCTTVTPDGLITYRFCELLTGMASRNTSLAFNDSYRYSSDIKHDGWAEMVMQVSFPPRRAPGAPSPASRGMRFLPVPLRFDPAASQNRAPAWTRSARGFRMSELSSVMSGVAYEPRVGMDSLLIHHATRQYSKLVALVRGCRTPEELSEHVEAAMASAPSDAATGVLLDALVAAATDPAQEHLAALLPRLGESHVQRVLLAFPAIANPSVIWEYTLHAVRGRGMLNAELALGVLADRLHDRGFGATAGGVLAFLRTEHSEAARRGDCAAVERLTHALANCRVHADISWMSATAELAQARCEFLNHTLRRINVKIAGTRVVPRHSVQGPDTAIAQLQRPTLRGAHNRSIGGATARNQSEDLSLGWSWAENFNGAFGSDLIGVAWEANFEAEASVSLDLVVQLKSYNEARVTAHAFTYEVELASADLHFDIRSFTNGLTVNLLGYTIAHADLPCIACELRCVGPSDTLASGQFTFLEFERTFFVGFIPVDLSVSAIGGYDFSYELQMCVLNIPPDAHALISTGAFALVRASAGVDLLIVRGGISADITIFNGHVEPLAKAFTVAGESFPGLQFRMLLEFHLEALTGSVDAWYQTRGCGGIEHLWLEWCDRKSTNLFSWNGVQTSQTPFDWCYDLLAGATETDDSTRMSEYAISAGEAPPGSRCGSASPRKMVQFYSSVDAVTAPPDELAFHNLSALPDAGTYPTVYRDNARCRDLVYWGVHDTREMRRIPVWTAFRQRPGDRPGLAKPKRFYVDDYLRYAPTQPPPWWIANWKGAQASDVTYTGSRAQRIARGHLSPVYSVITGPPADAAQAAKATQFYTNLIPQDADTNSLYWSYAEGCLAIGQRGTVTHMWIVTGRTEWVRPEYDEAGMPQTQIMPPIGTPGLPADTTQVMVPRSIWKLACAKWESDGATQYKVMGVRASNSRMIRTVEGRRARCTETCTPRRFSDIAVLFPPGLVSENAVDFWTDVRKAEANAVSYLNNLVIPRGRGATSMTLGDSLGCAAASSDANFDVGWWQESIARVPDALRNAHCKVGCIWRWNDAPPADFCPVAADEGKGFDDD